MFKTDPGADRALLGFKDAVISNFAFLDSYGLKLKRRQVTLVRYESKKVFVDVYHGRASFEIGVQVGLLDRSERYSLGYIVSWAGKPAWEAEGFGRGTIFQVSSREGVQRIASTVAQILKKYGEPFLRGDPSFYDELEKANRRASEEYTRRQLLENVREDAQSAWAAKEYARFVELYQPMRDELSKIESQKLAYAEKHIGTTVPTGQGEGAKRK